MRARTVYPLLFSGLFLLLTTLLIVWGSPPAPGWAAGLAWTDLQGPKGGPAQALALNPEYPSDQTILAGGGNDMFYASWLGLGIFRSLDSGATWDESGGPPRGAVLDVAFSPRWQQDGLAIAGLWQGVWATHDRGASWQQLSGEEKGQPGWVSAVSVTSPAPGSYTFLAGGAYGGLYRSADAGVTWNYLFDPGGVRRLAVDPVSPTIVLAATGTGLWRSTDAGLQWTKVTTATQVSDVALGADGYTYAIFDDQAWRSQDGGVTWQAINTPAVQYLDTIGLSADGVGLFMAAGPHLYRYDVAANALLTVTTDLATGDILRLAPSPTFGEDKTLLAGAYDGVWISHDGGGTFMRSDGFAPMEVTSVKAAGGRHDGDLFAAGPYGIWRHSAGSWQSLNADLLGAAATTIVDLAVSPAYQQDHMLFAIQSLLNSLGASLLRSSDGGHNWQPVLYGMEYMNQVALSPDFAADGRVYLVGTKRMWSSADRGDTWAEIPYWDEAHTVRRLVISPGFAQDHTLVAVGNQVYRSIDAGLTWQPVADAPILSNIDGTGWAPSRLLWTENGRLYLSIYTYEEATPFLRHDQLWTSSDAGQTWAQLTTAPDLPIESVSAGPSAAGKGEALYISVFDDREGDESIVPPDLYVSRDNGATWLNLGAIPGGPARLDAPIDVPDQVWAGSQGVWLSQALQAPTATPNPVQELLSNRSFEYTGVWRIPDTAYDAAYSQDQHYEGYWSMRTGITDPGNNVRSYSDFSQDVTLPVTGTVSLQLHRWAEAGSGAEISTAALAAAQATTVEEFYRALDATAGDLQYALVIEQPGNKIHYLYTRLDNQQAWEGETFDLKDYLGKTVRLQFGTYNDGIGATAVQYFDVVRLQAISPTQPTPTGIPTGIPTLERQVWLPYVETGRTR